ncbi:hypothetical protein ACWDKQ_34450 [Saccharopolyspora sp. NPDC000995]
MTWAEERRKDRQADREQDRLDRQFDRDEARKDRQEKASKKEKKAGKRAAKWETRRAALKVWAADKLPWLVIMVTPMAMAWVAMASFGQHIYLNPIGLLLPLFSEAVTIKVAFEIQKRMTTTQPVGLLRIGLVVFAAVQAVLNYLHGATDVTTLVDGQQVITEPGSFARGVVMALVSLGGVAVHQMVHGRTPQPRRTPEQRRADALARKAALRTHRIQAAAIRSAVPVLADDGTVTLVHRSGPVAVEWSWCRRTVAPTVVPGLPVAAAGDALADEVAGWLASQPGTAGNSGNAADGDTSGTTSGTTGATPEMVARVRAAIAADKLPPSPSRREVQRFLKVRAATAQDVLAELRDGGDGGVTVHA